MGSFPTRISLAFKILQSFLHYFNSFTWTLLLLLLLLLTGPLFQLTGTDNMIFSNTFGSSLWQPKHFD